MFIEKISYVTYIENKKVRLYVSVCVSLGVDVVCFSKSFSRLFVRYLNYRDTIPESI